MDQSEKDALLEEAKRRYPKGTRYIPAHVGKGINEVTGNNYSVDSCFIHVDSDEIDGSYTGCIYDGGRWAEIVSKPEEKELTSLPEKWCIRISNEEVRDVVGKWFNENKAGHPNTSYDYTKTKINVFLGKGNGILRGLYKDFSKITFDQFKKWVLKESGILKVEDLVEGEIYRYHYKGESTVIIGKCTSNGTAAASAINESSKDFWLHGRFNMTSHMSKATDEEKQWLEACIRADKFVSFEDSKKSDVPEYVECVKVYGEAVKGKIYNTGNSKEARSLFGLTWEQVLIEYHNLDCTFKRSTKEAFDAQSDSPKAVKTEMTPAEKFGYKVGDKFKVIKPVPFEVGDIITFNEDDGSNNPWFTNDQGMIGAKTLQKPIEDLFRPSRII